MTYSEIDKKLKSLERERNIGLITYYDAFKETKDLGIKKPALEAELKRCKVIGLVTRQQADDIEKLINS